MELNISKTDRAVIEVAKILAEADNQDWGRITYGTQLAYIHRVKRVLRAFVKAGYKPIFRRVK